MTGTYGYLLCGAIAIAGMICAVFHVALDSFDMLFALSGNALFIFHHFLLLSDFCSYNSPFCPSIYIKSGG